MYTVNTVTTNIEHIIRSIFPKDFSQTKKVPLSVIQDILSSANWAPTHGKTEPWRFCVVVSN
jgi:nitroreductase